MADLCPCGTNITFAACCEPYLTGSKTPSTAEALMRARYTAHCKQNYQYLEETTHPEHKDGASVEEVRQWAESVVWNGLSILDTKKGLENDNTGEVSFLATYELDGAEQSLREDSVFRKLDGTWYYADGKVHGGIPYRREEPKIGRNDSCPCKSGKKYKKCCGA